MNKKGQESIMGWIFFGGFILLFALLMSLTNLNLSPEQGVHIGYITETGYGGLIFPTHYAKVVSSNFAYGDDGSSWTYGIREDREDALIFYEQLKDTQAKHKIVNVHYTCMIFSWIWEQDSSCVINSLEEINSTEGDD